MQSKPGSKAYRICEQTAVKTCLVDVSRFDPFIWVGVKEDSVHARGQRSLSVGRTSAQPTSCQGSTLRNSNPLQMNQLLEYCTPPCLWPVNYETALGGFGAFGGGSRLLLPSLVPEDRTRLLLLRILQAQLVQGNGVLPQLWSWGQLGNAGLTRRKQKDQDLAAGTW